MDTQDQLKQDEPDSAVPAICGLSPATYKFRMIKLPLVPRVEGGWQRQHIFVHPSHVTRILDHADGTCEVTFFTNEKQCIDASGQDVAELVSRAQDGELLDLVGAVAPRGN